MKALKSNDSTKINTLSKAIVPKLINDTAHQVCHLTVKKSDVYFKN